LFVCFHRRNCFSAHGADASAHLHTPTLTHAPRKGLEDRSLSLMASAWEGSVTVIL
jgi:hypothetical protein